MNPKRKMITVHFPFSFSFFSISPLSCASSSFLSCPSDRISRMSRPDVRRPRSGPVPPAAALRPRAPASRLRRKRPGDRASGGHIPTPRRRSNSWRALPWRPRLGGPHSGSLVRYAGVRATPTPALSLSLSLSLRARPVNGAGWDHFCQMKLAKATFSALFHPIAL